MIRALTLADYAAALVVLDSNEEFVGGLKLANYRDIVANGLRDRLTIDKTALVLGGFDEQGLTAWTSFKTWAAADALAYTWNYYCPLTTRPAVLQNDLLAFAVPLFEAKKLFTMYARFNSSEAAGQVAGLTAKGAPYADYAVETVSIIYPNKVTSNPLLNKYVVTATFPYPRTIIRLDKKP